MVTPEDRRRFEAHVRRLVRTVDRLEDGEVRQLLADLRDARAELDRRIRAGTADVAASDFTPAQARRFKQEIAGVVEQVWSRYAGRLRQTEKRIIDEAIGGVVDGTEATIEGRVIGGPTLTADLVTTSSRWQAILVGRSEGIRAAADEQIRRISMAVNRGILTGEGPGEISRGLARSGWLGPLRRADGGLIGVAARAETIARTEVGGIFSTAGQIASERLQQAAPTLRLVKSWITVDDDRVRESHERAGENYSIDGNDPGPIAVDEDFMVGGWPASGPHDPRLPAEERINCRCRRVVFSAQFFEARRAA